MKTTLTTSLSALLLAVSASAADVCWTLNDKNVPEDANIPQSLRVSEYVQISVEKSKDSDYQGKLEVNGASQTLPLYAPGFFNIAQQGDAGSSCERHTKWDVKAQIGSPLREVATIGTVYVTYTTRPGSEYCHTHTSYGETRAANYDRVPCVEFKATGN